MRERNPSKGREIVVPLPSGHRTTPSNLELAIRRAEGQYGGIAECLTAAWDSIQGEERAVIIDWVKRWFGKGAIARAQLYVLALLIYRSRDLKQSPEDLARLMQFRQTSQGILTRGTREETGGHAFGQNLSSAGTPRGAKTEAHQR